MGNQKGRFFFSAVGGHPEVCLQLDLSDQPRLVVVADLNPAAAGAGGDAPKAGRALGALGLLLGFVMRRLLGWERRCLVLLGALAKQGSKQIAWCGWHGCGVTASFCQCCQGRSAGAMASSRPQRQVHPSPRHQAPAAGQGGPEAASVHPGWRCRRPSSSAARPGPRRRAGGRKATCARCGKQSRFAPTGDGYAAPPRWPRRR